MPNIQSVSIVGLNGVPQSGAPINYDLSCGVPEQPKRLTTVYIITYGATIQEVSAGATGAIKVTKIFNCDGTIDYSSDAIGFLQNKLIPKMCCNDLLTYANQLILNGNTWVPNHNVKSFSYAVISIANASVPPTYRGSDNVITSLYAGETAYYELADGTNYFDFQNILITANAGDLVKVVFTEKK